MRHFTPQLYSYILPQSQPQAQPKAQPQATDKIDPKLRAELEKMSPQQQQEILNQIKQGKL